MNQTLHCIALRTVAISDSKSLVTAWSREAGRVTFAFPAGGSRESRRRRALSSPLGLFEGRSEIKPGHEILSLRDFSPMAGSPALAPRDIWRTMQATFLAEVLDRLLTRTAPEEILSDYLFDSMRTLARTQDARACANFHLVFLYGLCRFAGIAPNLDGLGPGAVFDLREGCCRSSRPLHTDYIDAPQTPVLRILARANFNNMHRLRFSRDERREILARMLQYYSIHLGTLSELKSLAVLSELD